MDESMRFACGRRVPVTLSLANTNASPIAHRAEEGAAWTFAYVAGRVENNRHPLIHASGAGALVFWFTRGEFPHTMLSMRSVAGDFGRFT